MLQVSYGIQTQKAAVVNTLMGVYLENNLLANRVETGGQFIASQLPQTELLCVKQSWLLGSKRRTKLSP